VEIASLKFAFLAIASVFIFYLLNPKLRIGFLLLLSFGFVTTYNYYLVSYVIIYAIINFFIGAKIPNSKHKIALFRAGVIFNLTQLIAIRYSSFVIDPIFQYINSDLQISKLSDFIIPLGISYYTLQGIGYLINIRMGWERPEKRFPDFLLYIIFYPKFLSGPIERSNHFLPQLKSVTIFNELRVSEGLRMILFGFFKKVVIANNLGIIVNKAHLDLASLGGVDLWIVVLIQPLFLYFDFSGYTDIAIGLAKTYGIDLLPNFNKPFMAENMTNFWRRFHISLSAWFNDYIFKQLSFKCRKWGNNASIFAVFVTWTLFGIWHGSGWNFMALGLLQALAIIYEFVTKSKRIEIFSEMSGFWRTMMSRIITYVYYGLSLIFFFSPNLGSSLQYFSKLVDFGSHPKVTLFSHLEWLALGFSAIIIIMDYLKQDQKETGDKIEKFFFTNRFFRIVTYYLMVLLIITFVGRKLVFVYQVF
jgi:alginate O-acetyltransferase complex protein AlgI